MKFASIAEFALTKRDMPESALEMAATLLIDTLGVAAGAVDLEAGRIALDHAHAFHGPGAPELGAPMLFDGRCASIPGAAFAGATQIDNLDAHDGFNPTKGHMGCALVPALFAFAHANPALSGRDALGALVMAYEIAARAGQALHASVADYHTSGAWNALGVAALGCRLRGATADQLRQALGIAEYHGPRSQMMREIANPSMLHDGSGMGAMGGAMAALMALSGFTGAPALTVEAEAAAPFWSDLGAAWTIEQNYIKPYPICRWAHAALDALSGLIATHGISAQTVARIEVETFTEAAALYPGMPETTSQAQYSLPFALAALLIHGQIGPAQITGAGLTDPRVAAILPRIEIREARRHTARFPQARWSDVSVTLHDGRQFASGDTHARGGPEAPMDQSEIDTKFRILAAALPAPRVAALLGMRSRLLQPQTRFAELARLACAPGESTDG